MASTTPRSRAVCSATTGSAAPSPPAITRCGTLCARYASRRPVSPLWIPGWQAADSLRSRGESQHSLILRVRSSIMKRIFQLAAGVGLSLSVLGSAPPVRPGAVPDDAAILNRFDDLVGADLACAQL